MNEPVRPITDPNYQSSLVPPPLTQEERKSYAQAIMDFVGFRKKERENRERLQQAFDFAEIFRAEERLKDKAAKAAQVDSLQPVRMKGVAGRMDGSVKAQPKRPTLVRRTTPPLRMRVLNDFYETAEWTLGGVLIAHYDGDLEAGMTVTGAFRVDTDDDWFECRMNIVRRNREDKILALSFTKIESRAFARLQELIGKAG